MFRSCFCRFACSLLRQGMKQIIITLESPDIIALEKEGNKDAIFKVTRKKYHLYSIDARWIETIYKQQQQQLTNPFVPSTSGWLHELKENYICSYWTICPHLNLIISVFLGFHCTLLNHHKRFVCISAILIIFCKWHLEPSCDVPWVNKSCKLIAT